MLDKFGVPLREGDFVIYNECSVGKIIGQPTKVTKEKLELSYLYTPVSFTPSTKIGLPIKTEHGKNYILTDFKKVIKIGGLPKSIMEKFK
jgi:hypothetical protein